MGMGIFSWVRVEDFGLGDWGFGVGLGIEILGVRMKVGDRMRQDLQMTKQENKIIKI